MDSEVPYKFAAWLLSMGCPSEKIPPMEKLKQMCRGDYYMVWRDMLERVAAKQVIREKRQQVFVTEVRKSLMKRTNLKEVDNKVPEELAAWREFNDVKSKLECSEKQVMQKKQELRELMRKVSRRVGEQSAVERRVQEWRRRAYLLERLTEELTALRENLEKTRSIAHAFQHQDQLTDIQIKMEKCIALLNRQKSSSQSNPGTSASTNGDNIDIDLEQHVSSLVSGHAGEVWRQVYERRAALVETLSAANSHLLTNHDHISNDNRASAQSVLAQGAALHCWLVLETVRNNTLISELRDKLATALTQFHGSASAECAEVAVVRCERARGEARGHVLRAQLEELAATRGVYATHAGHHRPDHSGLNVALLVANLHRNMETKKSDLKRITASLVKRERSIQNVRDNLENIFSGFRAEITGNCTITTTNRFGELEESMDSVSSTRHFYEQRRNRPNNMELSLDLDVSDSSFNNCRDDNQEVKLSHELKLYLKNFNLEHNKKLVLESGETVWMFETLQESAHRFNALALEHVCEPLLTPAVDVVVNMRRLVELVQRRDLMMRMLAVFKSSGDSRNNKIIDITSVTQEDSIRTDRQKKMLNDNILSLEKTDKSISIGQENLTLWSQNILRKYISERRLVNGNTYGHFERVYMENLNPTCT